MYKSLATKAPQVFVELEHLFNAEAAGEQPDPWAKAQVRHAAKELQNSDPGAMFIAMAALASLDWDGAQVEAHLERATAVDGGLATISNAMVTYNMSNRFDMASKLARHVASHTSEEELLEAAGVALLGAGDLEGAAQVDMKLNGGEGSAVIPAYEALIAKEISPTLVEQLMLVATDVLSSHQRRVRQIETVCERDPDGSVSLAFDVGFFGTLEDEFRMDSIMCERLGDIPGWDPVQLTVHLSHLALPSCADTTS